MDLRDAALEVEVRSDHYATTSRSLQVFGPRSEAEFWHET